ncbi:hypothetical protein ACXZ1M_20365 [Duganella sp. PWIR1]
MAKKPTPEQVAAATEYSDDVMKAISEGLAAAELSGPPAALTKAGILERDFGKSLDTLKAKGWTTAQIAEVINKNGKGWTVSDGMVRAYFAKKAPAAAPSGPHAVPAAKGAGAAGAGNPIVQAAAAVAGKK